MAPPAKKKATQKRVNNSSYSNYSYAIWIIIGITVGVLASKYLRNQNLTTTATTSEATPSKNYDAPPPLPAPIDNSKKLSELRSKADNLSELLTLNFSELTFQKLMEIYTNILVHHSTVWDWWRISDTQWLTQASWTPLKVAAAKIFLNHNHNVQQAYQIFDEVAQDPNIDPNHYNVALDYITQYLLTSGNSQDAIYWLKYAISMRKDDSTVGRWYTFLLGELLATSQTEQVKKQAMRCIKDFEKISGFPYACYFEIALMTLNDGEYKEANRYFSELYAGGLKDNYKNELNQVCPSTELVQISLDSITSLERELLDRTLTSGVKLMDIFKYYSKATCSTQKWPLYLSEELEEDPKPAVTISSAEEAVEGQSKLRRVAKNKEGRNLGMRCYSNFQKLPIIYHLEDVLVQGTAKSMLETFDNRTGCNLIVPSFPYTNAFAFPRYFGLNAYRFESLPVYNIAKAFIPSFMDNNYYHLLLEAIPQVMIFLQSYDYDTSVKFIMYKSRAGDEIMSYLGLGDSLINYTPSTYRYHIERAYVPDWYFTDSENALNAPHHAEEFYVPPLPVIIGVRDAIFNFAKVSPSSFSDQNLVIFIHRPDEQARGITNSDRLYTYLESIVTNFGYQLVIHGKGGVLPSVAKQAELFSKAAIVVGIHGAGLTNILFCSPGASVIELPVFPEKVSVYSRLSSALNLPYYTVPSFVANYYAPVGVLKEKMVYDLRDTIEYLLSIHQSKYSQ